MLIYSFQALRSAISREHGLGSLFFGILEATEGSVVAGEVVGLLGRIIRRSEVNWEAVLIFVSTAIVADTGIDQVDLIVHFCSVNRPVFLVKVHLV